MLSVVVPEVVVSDLGESDVDELVELDGDVAESGGGDVVVVGSLVVLGSLVVVGSLVGGLVV